MAVRLRQLEHEFGADLHVEWRSYLLRPQPNQSRDLERFRAYTRSWEKPAAEPDGGRFRVWQGDAGPPSHSVPAHLLAKAAGRLGNDAFRAVHRRLLAAYFEENQDISDDATLARLWSEAGLPEARFEERSDLALLAQVLEEHDSAIEQGINGVPTVLIEGQDVPITGAHPL